MMPSCPTFCSLSFSVFIFNIFTGFQCENSRTSVSTPSGDQPELSQGGVSSDSTTLVVMFVKSPSDHDDTELFLTSPPQPGGWRRTPKRSSSLSTSASRGPARSSPSSTSTCPALKVRQEALRPRGLHV